MEIEGECVICKIKSKKKCGGCDDFRFYCSPEHQKSHWKVHKYECSKLFRIEDHEKLGHVYKAKKNIPQLTEIFKRKPLLVFPRDIYHSEYFDTPHAIPICRKYGTQMNNPKRACFGCCKLLVPNSIPPIIDYNRCSKCRWPVCDKNCELKLHEEECKIFVRNRIRYEEVVHWIPQQLYNAIGHLRLLILKRTKRAKYEQFLNLELDTDENRFRIAFEPLMVLKNFLFNRCSMPIVEDDEFMRGLPILCVNRYICNHRSALDTRYASIIYESEIGGKGMVLINSCMPNTCPLIDPETFEMTIMSVISIPADLILSITYDSCWLNSKYLRPLHKRQILLGQNGYRRCNCCLCIFQDNLGKVPIDEKNPRDIVEKVKNFKITAVKCQCGGLLSISFLRDNEWVWECDKCPATLSMDQYDKILSALENEFMALNKNGNEDDTDLIIKTIAKIEKMKTKIHETNGLIHFALFTLCHMIVTQIFRNGQNLNRFMYIFEEYFNFIDPVFNVNWFHSAFLRIFYSLFKIRELGFELDRGKIGPKELNDRIEYFSHSLMHSFAVISKDPLMNTHHGKTQTNRLILETMETYIDEFETSLEKKRNQPGNNSIKSYHNIKELMNFRKRFVSITYFPAQINEHGFFHYFF